MTEREQRDRISQLPNDILMSIISRLSLRDATATCILSTSWRHLPSHLTRLNFPPYNSFRGSLKKYTRMIDQVLNSHRGDRIKEFRLDARRCGGEFESWFEFAVSKKAEIIHISVCPRELYHRLPNANGLECLKELYLSNIHMTDQDFGYLVSTCVALERFTLYYVGWRNVSIVGLPKLKHLNLSHLWRTKTVVIRDLISLVSLRCCEWTGKWWLGECSEQLSNLPKLTKLELRNHSYPLGHIEFLAGMPSCMRDQLQLLFLSCRTLTKLNHDLSFQLANLKHLEIMFCMRTDCERGDWRHVIRLVKACRSLQKLVIKFGEVNGETVDHTLHYNPQKCLEISGYLGYYAEHGLILDLINNINITSLQKVNFVAPREAALGRARFDFEHIKSVDFLVIS
ncbi:putative FBD-associated F-box protein At5g56440 [Salvia hispanica]|uniref:putative FBD-associated F-box protein At5g56440 n=1 Tax=Salvia hispanica TaxID=49212 RepID=UPI0020098704|nr:putative FBD-associated F-box protein At5g56440 [Salvia hispanica]